MIKQICSLLMIPLLLPPLNVKRVIWESMTEAEQAGISTEAKAFLSGMTTEEFELMSAVVEAESDRSESLDGKELIALTILNRVESNQFPNSINGVIKQEGQFQVYYEGTYASVGRTASSDIAVVEAAFWIKQEHPNVIYFNCIGYNYLGKPYDYVDGNYFETL